MPKANKKDGNYPPEYSAPVDPIMGNPLEPSDIVNRRGVYNVQPTADTENDFPAIAQGLPEGDSMEPRREENWK